MQNERGRSFWRPLVRKPSLYQQGLHQHLYGPHTLVLPGGQYGPQRPPQAACWIGVKFLTALEMLAAPCEPAASAGQVRAPVNSMAVAMPTTIPNVRIRFLLRLIFFRTKACHQTTEKSSDLATDSAPERTPGSRRRDLKSTAPARIFFY